MRCHDAIELFTQYRDGALDAATRSALEAHLAACARCRDEFASLDAVCASLRALAPEPVPADFVAGVRARLQSGAERPRAVLLRWALPAGAAAVLVVVAFGIFTVMPRTRGVRGPVASREAGIGLSMKGAEEGLGTDRERKSVPPSAARDESVSGGLGVQVPPPVPGRQPQRPTRQGVVGGATVTRAQVPKGPPAMEPAEVPSAPAAGAAARALPESADALEPARTRLRVPADAAGRSAARRGQAEPRPGQPVPRPEELAPEQPPSRVAPLEVGPAPTPPPGAGFFERAREPSVTLSAQASRTQRAAGNLTLQLKPDEEIKDARVALRPAQPGGRETVLWEGKLSKSVSNAIDVEVPPPAVADAAAPAQQLIVSGSRMRPQAYYVFSPSATGSETEREKAHGRKLKAGEGAPAQPPWDVVLQNVATQNGVYVLAPAGFPVRDAARTGAQPSQRALATALKGMGYEVRPQEGAITIEPSAPRAAPPGPMRRGRG